MRSRSDASESEPAKASPMEGHGSNKTEREAGFEKETTQK